MWTRRSDTTRCASTFSRIAASPGEASEGGERLTARNESGGTWVKSSNARRMASSSRAVPRPTRAASANQRPGEARRRNLASASKPTCRPVESSTMGWKTMATACWRISRPIRTASARRSFTASARSSSSTMARAAARMESRRSPVGGSPASPMRLWIRSSVGPRRRFPLVRLMSTAPAAWALANAGTSCSATPTFLGG